MKKLKLAFICPRYLTSKAGGAEVLSRLMAEKLASDGHEVEYLATTALNHFTWAHEAEEKSFRQNNVTVRLFKVDERRDLSWFYEIESKISIGLKLTREEESHWVENSINSSALCDYLKTNYERLDFFIFIPYLFGLTIQGIKTVPGKSVMIPCLHEENFAYLNCIREIFQSTQHLLFNAPPEMAFAQKLYQIPPERCHWVSMGFDAKHTPDSSRFKNKYGITLPYITYAGRREDGKNFGLLLEMVRLFQRIYPNRIQFVTMGSPQIPLLSTDKGKIIDLGFVSEEEKLDCFAGALFNCQPSLNESFSIIMMESRLCNVPVMVHRQCSVTSYWVDTCKGGLKFSDYFEFEQNLNLALERPGLVLEMANNGKYFVEHNFTWSAVLDRFCKALQTP